MSSNKPIDNYPGIRNTSENHRLHVQHDLVVNAFGSLTVCPIDLSKENLRILDIGTADGHWLTELRKQLKHPESATLIGTDAAPYPDTTENVIIHNFKTSFPDDWKNSFDLIQLRAVLANVPGDAAVDLLKRATELLKPGSYIQSIDGAMPNGELSGHEKPSLRFFTTLGNFLNMNGLKSDQGANAGAVLKAAGEGKLEKVESSQCIMRLGKGASSAMEATSYEWIRGTIAGAGEPLVKAGLMSSDEVDELRAAMLKEAKNEGITFPWYAAWGMKAA
jgi:gliotoxin biosynthesis N-methyltransferase